MDAKWIEVRVRVRDPLAARLIEQIAARSNAGAEVYGSASLADRVKDPASLVAESLEEAVDQALYLAAALQVLSDRREI